jgi:hypothetical protein
MVTKVEQDQNNGLAGHPLWNGESARRNHPASDGEPIREEAESVAAPQVLADALVHVTEARQEKSGDQLVCSPKTGPPEMGVPR